MDSCLKIKKLSIVKFHFQQMKKKRQTIIAFFVLISLSFTLSFSSNAQKDTPKSFRDFLDYQNTDSLVKVIKEVQPHSQAMLRQLILLEKSRLKNSKYFGKNLNDIKRLSLLHKSSIGLNMYFYLNALFQLKINNEMNLAMTDMLKARGYFEAQKDTTGMIFCNFYLIALNVPPNRSSEVQGNIGNAKVYYQKNMTLGKASNFSLDKIMWYSTIITFGHDVNGKSGIHEIEIAFQNAIKIIDKNPELTYFKPGLYSNLSAIYQNYGLYNEALELEIEFEKNYQQWSSNTDINFVSTNLHNMAESYMNLGNYKMAEIYAKKSIAVFENAKNYQNNILPLTYGLLAEIQQKQQKYLAAWATRNKKDSLIVINKEAQNNKIVADIQAKYEAKKKDKAIKNLIYEQGLIKTRSQLLVGILVLSILVICLIGYFAQCLREKNVALKKLQRNRDNLFTIISHDLRSPLNAYQRYSEIVSYLVRSKQFERLDAVLNQINENSFHFASLLNNLLSWSLDQRKEVQYIPKYVLVKSICEEILPIYREMAKLKSITLVENIHEAEIYVDTNILSLIIRNLLDNAIKYTLENNDITIQTEFNYDEFKISVSNRSNLMTEVQKNKIKMLFETPNDFDFGEDGLGIGLILIKQYCDINESKATFESNDGINTFSVTIPSSFHQSNVNYNLSYN